MCLLVQVRGVWCESVADLRREVPCEPIMVKGYESMLGENDCMCGIDIDATLTKAGVEFCQDACGDYHVDIKAMGGVKSP